MTKFGLGIPEGVQGKVRNPPHSFSLNFSQTEGALRIKRQHVLISRGCVGN
jgi:hypothetical protein